MSKKSKPRKPETIKEKVPEVPEKKPEPDVVWSFVHGIRCPRCGSSQTNRISHHYVHADDVERQYRRCGSAVCRREFPESEGYRYSVDGRKI